MTEKEKRRLLNAAAGEDGDAPVLQPNPSVIGTDNSAAQQDAAATGPAAPRKQSARKRRQNKVDPEGEWSSRRRTSRKAATANEDILYDGSDIEVAQQTVPASRHKRRRGDNLDFPHGLEGEPTAPPPVNQLGEYFWTRGGWFAILPADPPEWINGRRVRNVPAVHREEVLQRGGIFEDSP